MAKYLQTITYKAQSDPLQGLIDYVQTIKPYHSKIYEIMVDYLFSDDISGAALDDWSMQIQLMTPDGSCGVIRPSIRVKTSTGKIATLAGDWVQFAVNDRVTVTVLDELDVPKQTKSLRVTDILYDGTNTVLTFNSNVPTGYLVLVEPVDAFTYTCDGGFGEDWDALADSTAASTAYNIVRFNAASVVINVPEDQLKPYLITTLDSSNNNLLICQTYDAISIDIINRSVTIAGNQVQHAFNGSTCALRNVVVGEGMYTVNTSTFNGTNTIITFSEPLPITCKLTTTSTVSLSLASSINGVLDLSAVPQFTENEKVSISGLSASGIPDGTYYVRNIQSYGIISLAYSRLGTTVVGVTGISQVGMITRTEPLATGSAITISDTKHRINDGDFCCTNITALTSTQFEIFLDNVIANPSLEAYGTVAVMSAEDVAGYDPGSAYGCQLTCAPDMLANGRVGERITFEMDVVFTDSANASTSEASDEGWDEESWDGIGGWDGMEEGITIITDE